MDFLTVVCVAVDVARSFVNNVKMRRVTKVIYVKNTTAGLDYAMSIEKSIVYNL